LIVEDESLLLDSLEASLRRLDWLRITKARSAEAALESIAKDPPDVVITDVRMPGMGGLELLDQLRVHKPDLPVVVMTAYGVHLQREALRRGATCFLEKPFRMSELRGVLQLLLVKSTTVMPEPSAQVSFEGRLESLSLADIVQVVCLSQQQARVEVSIADRMGVVWMRDGAVVDARYGTAEGLDAFYDLALQPRGRFRVLPDTAPRPRSIVDSWQELLMEAARRFDEMVRGTKPSERPSFRPSLPVPLASGRPRPPSLRPVPPVGTPSGSLADMLKEFSSSERPPPLASTTPARSNPAEPLPEAPDEAVRAGAEAMERGELDIARRIFERAIERWPEERLLRANLSRLTRLSRAKVSPNP